MPVSMTGETCLPQSTYRGRGEIGGVYISALSAAAYATNLLVMVDRVKGGGRAVHRLPHQAGLILPTCWNVRQKVAIATM